MPKTKKKFINKKKAVTFQLVNRSLQDPMSVDEDAPQQVLKPILKETAEERANRIDEQHKYGIYFTDDTNYLEFLKERSDHRMEWPAEKQIEEYRKRFQLPSEVFASTTEENVGPLNKGTSAEESLADVDPDVLAAMEDDFNFDDPDNQLEDDFIELADGFLPDSVEKDYDNNNKNVKFEDENSDTDTLDDDDSYDSDTLNNDDDECSEESQDERSQSSFSYSNDPKDAYQQMLSKQFDRMLNIYDEASRQLHEEEDEESKGPDGPTEEEINMFEEDLNERRRTFQLDRDEDVIAKTKELAKKKNAFKTTYAEFEVKEKPADCQSRISTNTQNRPTVVEIPKKPRKIEISKKTGMPINVLGNNNKLTLAALKQHNKDEESKVQGPRSVYTSVSLLSFRDKNESLEEKRKRKQELKMYRRERRMEKKQNKLDYKSAK